ncbi:MAG TPA: ribosome-associated translation inhibitor RaiA [Alphaproteobacteria bacterium]|nr:ribosome-associated translation inhibitor RaiA [Alphaproteobacteria bacterium]
MAFRVSGKNIAIGEALRQRVSARIGEALEKYFDGGYSGHVTIGKDGFGFRTECALHLDSGMTLEAKAVAADAYASADQAATRIEKRLRRYKRRLKDHPSRRDEVTGAAPSDGVVVPPESEAPAVAVNPAIVAESMTALKRLSVGDAVRELDLTGAAAVVFRHAGHGRVNLVYRRPDGHIGWVDPPALSAAGAH